MDHQKIFLIIEDHEIVVWGLKAFIEKNVIGSTVLSASDIDDGLEAIKKSYVSLVILDIDLPGGNTTICMDRLREIQPKVPILVHTGLSERDYSLEYLLAGADGFISKNAPFDELPVAIKSVLEGGRYISPLTHNFIADRFLNNKVPLVESPRIEQITDREKDVARMLMQGRSTKEIAADLGLRLTTVSTHKGHIFEKLGVNNLVDLFKRIQQTMPEILNDI